MAQVEALRDLYSTVASVGRRKPRERFTCSDALARELEAYGMVKVLHDPKPEGVSSVGQDKQPVSSSLEAQASTKNKQTTSAKPTKNNGAKR